MVDVGAGVGDLALYFMKVYGPDTVFAFEPQAAQRAVLARHLAANDWKPSDLSLSANFVGIGEGCTRLDDIRVDPAKRGFVKIDVDGAEAEVLRSGADMLRTKAADFLVEVHSEALEEECIALFEANGYRVEIIPNAWWRLFIPERRVEAHNRWIAAVPA